MLQKSKISFRSELRVIEDMQKNFLALEKNFSMRVEKNFPREIPVDDIVFELKNFSYIKAFLNNTL